MSINWKAHKEDLIFVPLGGSNEIGMNLNLYHYKGKWLIVDLGIGFADDFLPGVEIILPNIEFLHEIKKDIVGLVLTHAHEDHLGAVPYLWHEIGCPVYATPFTASILRHKMADDGLTGKIPVHEIKTNGSLVLEPFSMELVDLTHSIPEMQAIAIKTDRGSVMHTGDWKLDPTPMVGPASNEDALRQFGDDGILAMVCDSTNVFVEGISGSESDVERELATVIAACKERVIVTCFASNIARVQSIVRAGQKAGRKIVLSGRSLFRVTAAAQESGYLQDVEFYNDKEAMGLPRNEVMILCTGGQGEPRAALSKIVQQQHPYIRIHEGDTVIFSSRVIPGNETKVRHLSNKLALMGAELVTDRDVPIHVSGHPCRSELQQMYQLIRPKIAVPVHGEALHIHEHAKFARAMQVPHVLEPSNGAVICLASATTPVGQIGRVTSGYQAMDGHSLIPTDSIILKTRRKLREDGSIMISVVVGKNGEVLGRPHITAPGCLDSIEDEELIDELRDEIQTLIEESGARGKGKPDRHAGDKKRKGKAPGAKTGIEEKIHNTVRRTITKELGKKPVLEIHIHHV